MADKDFTCDDCKYYKRMQVMGICKRFPVQSTKHETEWCGEHQPVKKPVMVYDITTDKVVKRKYTRKVKHDAIV